MTTIDEMNNQHTQGLLAAIGRIFSGFVTPAGNGLRFKTERESRGPEAVKELMADAEIKRMYRRAQRKQWARRQRANQPIAASRVA